MGRLTLFQQENLLELDGLLLQIGDRIEILLLGAFIPGTISHDEHGWYITTRENTGIRVQAGLPARLLSRSSNSLPVQLVNCGERGWEHFAQDSSGDDALGDEDIDRIFSRLDQLHPPADFVNRVRLVVSRLPLLRMWEVDAEFMVHHEDKPPS